MYLFINTAGQDNINLALFDNKGILLKKKKIIARYKQSEKLLVNIEKIISSSEVRGSSRSRNNLVKLKGIIVVKGPGRFTSLRIGVATANTIAWALQIPIIGVTLGEDFKDSIKKLNKLKKFKSVVPEYGMEPNISKSKNK